MNNPADDVDLNGTNANTEKNESDTNTANDENGLLNSALKKIETKRSQNVVFRSILIVLFVVTQIVIATITIIDYNIHSSIDWTLLGLSVYSFVFLAALLFFPLSGIDARIDQIKDEIDLQSVGTKSSEMRAEKQFKLHQKELKRYYDQSLKQGSWIFYIGIANLFAGLIIIGVTLYLVSNSDDKLIVGAVGGVSGVLTNFIAVIFLRMYSGTIKSLSDFHNRLVFSNHLHYSNLLVSKIFDEKLRTETWAQLALKIVEKEKESNNEKDQESIKE